MKSFWGATGIDPGPLYLIFLICDLFLLTAEVNFANFADDTAPYVIKDNIEVMIKSLEVYIYELQKWFKENSMKLNPDKFQFIINCENQLSLKISDFTIQCCDSVSLLGIQIDRKLSFKTISQIYAKSISKNPCFGKIALDMDIEKRKITFSMHFRIVV